MSRLPKPMQDYSEILVTLPPRGPAPLPLGGKWPGPVPLVREHLDEIVAEAREDRARAVREAAWSLIHTAIAPFRALARSWRAWRKHERDMEELLQLDDRALADMGISRYDALVAAKSARRRD
ncbi:MAG: DUF1127 domain-containing protein [Alphaproteobacteria bacterium]